MLECDIDENTVTIRGQKFQIRNDVSVTWIVEELNQYMDYMHIRVNNQNNIADENGNSIQVQGYNLSDIIAG